MSLSSILPQPTQFNYYNESSNQPKLDSQKKRSQNSSSTIQTVVNNLPPPYGNRQNFIPRLQSDYNDGGAYPECLVPQYPLEMGRKSNQTNLLSRTTPVSVDSSGSIQYDAIVKQNIRQEQHVFSRPHDLLEKQIDDDEREEIFRKPGQKVAQAVTENTRLALEKIIEGKIQSARPRNADEEKTSSNAPVYIRYTPMQQGEEYNSGSKTRIIRMQNMQVDPMEPPKYQYRKMPEGPPSPPVPVMQSPPRRVTREDQENWKIPPCISNWKNIKGYTIPLDKRLAADGRGLESVTINSRFSALSTALYEAENIARENVRVRGEHMKKIQKQKRQQKEDELELRARSALERQENAADLDDPRREMQPQNEMETKEQAEARLAREELRRERVRERRRELRIENRDDKRRRSRRSRYDREKDRDISERIALGQKVEKTSETMYDQRLFNQTQGMDTGFKQDDAYDVYDKPLFKVNQSTYKPKDLNDFSGNEESSDGESKRNKETRSSRLAVRRENPVAFVKESKEEKKEDKMVEDKMVEHKKEIKKERQFHRLSRNGESERRNREMVDRNRKSRSYRKEMRRSKRKSRERKSKYSKSPSEKRRHRRRRYHSRRK